MGRILPKVELPQSISEEVVLVQALDEAIARVLAARDVFEYYLDAAVERVLADLDGSRSCPRLRG